ncbi:hypothetical protein SE15_03105 [Thermanaerothrix daxensis]|uniref:AAA domain-containing protein n=1 Tax=Thermanaerothrix daxensis TaxID=869279 RepID=A0A0P6XV88_9CHLR|nr:ParA family protein [Thermanaerothrix daxensis]KPL84167.1 hypothetical protein SE15_03105 [Thermanaerothrix daxensis]
MTKVITIANQKGGAGKTTTVLNLAHGLALKGKEVLILDFDPQGQSASYLGLKQEPGIFFLLMSSIKPLEKNELILLRQQVRSTGRPRLWIIPGSQETAVAQNSLAALDKPVSYIRDAIQIFMRNGLDYIVMDTSPSLGGLQERAIWAADFVIVPVAMEFGSLEGLDKTLGIMRNLKENKGWRGSLAGVLPTFYDDVTRETKKIEEDLKAGFGDLVLSPIHRATLFRECIAEGQTIFEKAPGSRAAQEYARLVDQVLKW